MKKLSLLMALLMLSGCLVGCGGSADDTRDAYGKYDDLIEYIEDGDYKRAKKELASLMGVKEDADTADVGGADTTDGFVTTDAVTDAVTDAPVTEKPEDNGPDHSRYESLVVGEWLPSIEEKQEYTAHPIFNSDKTCELFSEKLMWKIERVFNEGKEDQELEIAVYANGERKYIVYHKLGEFENIRIDNRLDSQKAPNFPFYKASDYTRVEIDLNNLLLYFEDREITTFQTNAFGEINHADVVKFLLAKEEYEINPNISHVAIEYSHVSTVQSYVADIENKTVTFDEPKDRDDVPTVNDTTFRIVYYDVGKKSYGLMYNGGTTPITQFPTGTVYRDVYTLTRTAGYIYIKK